MELSDGCSACGGDLAPQAQAEVGSCRAVLEQILERTRSPASSAAGLIAEFGNVGAALAGPRSRQLRGASGDDHAVSELRRFRSLMTKALRADLLDRPVLHTPLKVEEYLRASMAFEAVESFRVLHLNVQNRLVRDEVVSRGTIDQTSVHVREVIVRALELGSAGLVLAHNHPSGDATPSRADVALTKAIGEAGRLLDIVVHDHIVVASGGYVSMRERGLL